MRKIVIAIAACLTLVASAAQAHGPSRLKTEQTVRLNATPAEVWAVIGNFGDMSWYPGTVSVEAEGNAKGALRKRTMEGGVVVTEELLKIDPAKHAISTRMTVDNLDAVAATNYASHITIRDDGGKAVVDWKGAFYRAFPQNDPPADQNDDAALAAVLALHQTGIDALLQRFGAAE